MKNLIGNSCISSYITKECLKQKFINPFCWCDCDFESFYNLIKYWDKINWNNFELIKDENNMFYTIIDNKVKIRWVHYQYSPKRIKIFKGKVNVKYFKINEYITEKYIERIKRMLENNLEPVFIIGTPIAKFNYNKEQIKKICEINSPYKIIIIDMNYNIVNENSNVIFHTLKEKKSYLKAAKEIFDTYEFLK